jgi:rubrerythrin
MSNKKLALLTAEINKLSQKRINISQELNGKKCRGCLGNDAKYQIDTSETDTYLCDTCVTLIQSYEKSELKKNPENDCPICGDDDGKYFIKGLTTNLCKECFKYVKTIKV